MNSLQEIATTLKAAKSVVIFSHARPDGDCVGSAMSLFFALRQLNIPCEAVNADDMPEDLLFLDGVKEMKKTPTLDAEVYVAVDSADENRLGDLTETFLAGKKKLTINIDHHISNTRYAKMNYVCACSANCENMTDLLKEMGITFDEKISSLLMLGLLTDSDRFSHNDVTERTFLTAAFLKKFGVKMDEMNYNLFTKQTKRRALLYAHTMNKLRFALDDRLAITVVTKEDLERFSAKQEDTRGFVSFPLSIDTVEVSLALMESRKGQFKVSLRSKGKTNVNAIAAVYGGGGHILASGCMMFGDLEEVIDRMTYTVSQYLED